ncbi:MAG: tRNA (adenine(22)-N(1))-methyltransferase TrmK [Oscillospiraceae bacterium]
MKRITLQPRLRLLAEMTPPGGRLADIGTDHGYLPVWLLQEGRIPSAIASDVGAEPLEHARRTAEEYGDTGAGLPAL